MKLNLTQNVIDEAILGALKIAGIPVDKLDVTVTAQALICRALVNGAPGENPPADEKLKHYELLMKISGATGDLDLPVESVTLLKTLVGKSYPAMYAGRLHEILDPKPKAQAAA